MDVMDDDDLPPRKSKGMSSRQPVVTVRIGRGRIGGSTVSDLLVQLGRNAGRRVIVVDGDLRNSSLAAFYPEGTEGAALRPASDDMVDVKALISLAINKGIEEQASVVIDLGGGDRVLQEYGRELALVELCESVGLDPLAVYVTGPEMDDFDHILSIWRAGVFRTKRSLLFVNEHLVPQGRSPGGAFDSILVRQELAQMIREGSKVIVLPRLPCMPEMRSAGLSLFDALNGKNGNRDVPLDPVRRFMIRHWLKRINEALEEAAVLSWLP